MLFVHANQVVQQHVADRGARGARDMRCVARPDDGGIVALREGGGCAGVGLLPRTMVTMGGWAGD